MPKEVEKERKLNQGQIELLYLLYRFRFATGELLAQALGKKSATFVYPRLKVLSAKGYIARNYDGNYKIQGKPATYYLLPKAFQALRAAENLQMASSASPKLKTDSRAFKRMYKDKDAAEPFIHHCLSVFAAHNRLRALYGQGLKFFTKSDLTSYNFFPKSPPDGYLVNESQGQAQRFFLDIFGKDTPFFLIAKQVKQYLDYFEKGEWPEDKYAFPVILLTCETEATEKKLQRFITKNLEAEGIDSMAFATTTTKQFLESTDDAIWQQTNKPDARVAMSSIQNFPLA